MRTDTHRRHDESGGERERRRADEAQDRAESVDVQVGATSENAAFQRGKRRGGELSLLHCKRQLLATTRRSSSLTTYWHHGPKRSSLRATSSNEDFVDTAACASAVRAPSEARYRSALESALDARVVETAQRPTCADARRGSARRQLTDRRR